MIGSHICVELMASGYQVTVIDNLGNSKEEALHRVSEITGRAPGFVRADLRDRGALDALFRERDFDAVIHCAGFKAVGKSTRIPLDYYENNIGGTLTLCKAMAAAGIRNIVFSSSATVYGDPATVPIREDFPICATNPYGRSKLFIEEILGDLHRSDGAWNVAFPDGTGIRDYIHVTDLAKGHLGALARLTASPGVVTYNLGTGRGYSVLEMVRDTWRWQSQNPDGYG